jgi:excisionase family DNA binding protein
VSKKYYKPDYTKEEIVDVGEAARVLQICKMSVYRLCREGKIPHFRVGGSIRFKREMIENPEMYDNHRVLSWR